MAELCGKDTAQTACDPPFGTACAVWAENSNVGLTVSVMIRGNQFIAG
ncbi:MAG: hypothetical protein KA447_14655 [Pyrinomonadaceae bacterium]|nr:hypothetical protein [Pyrinomonadaceae bacterium]